MTANLHPQRTKFDTLFAEPRHYRGDCRLLRTAIRRGWLNEAPQADRDAIVVRFMQANAEREAAGFVSELQQVRTILSQARAWIEMECQNQRDRLGPLRYAWAGVLTDRTTGRPRQRWYVGDFPNRIDANDIRRRARDDGMDLRNLQAVNVRPARAPDDTGELVALAVVPEPRYGWRVWLVCPGCQKRRAHLYPVRTGVRCRECSRIGYPPQNAVPVLTADPASPGMPANEIRPSA